MNRALITGFLVFWFSGLLTACGFHPMYSTQGSPHATLPQLTNVRIALIKDESGQALRNALLDRMPTPVAVPRYVLNIGVTEAQIGIAITSSATITRQQLRDTLHAELFDTAQQQVVWKQDISTTSGYNILDSQFSTLIGQQDAQQRNIDDLSQRMVDMLALFFDRPAEEQKLPTPVMPPIVPPSLSSEIFGK